MNPGLIGVGVAAAITALAVFASVARGQEAPKWGFEVMITDGQNVQVGTHIKRWATKAECEAEKDEMELRLQNSLPRGVVIVGSACMEQETEASTVPKPQSYGPYPWQRDRRWGI
jgi:hypothetical protein